MSLSSSSVSFSEDLNDALSSHFLDLPPLTSSPVSTRKRSDSARSNQSKSMQNLRIDNSDSDSFESDTEPFRLRPRSASVNSSIPASGIQLFDQSQVETNNFTKTVRWILPSFSANGL